MKRHWVLTAMLFLLSLATGLHAQSDSNAPSSVTGTVPDNMIKKMIVEVWSDITCPYCYMGKRKFEMALEKFPEREHVQIIWRSFQLNPEAVTDTSISVFDELVRVKGWSPEQVKQITAQVTQSAAQVGLTYRFEDAVVVNTMKAHALLHYALKHGKQNEVKEALFRSYFTDGKNVDDPDFLVELALEAGLDTTGLRSALMNGDFEDEIKQDILESRQIGVRGVPFFIFDRKYAVSGAQEPSAFASVLEQSFAEWQKTKESEMKVLEGQQCTPQGKCE